MPFLGHVCGSLTFGIASDFYLKNFRSAHRIAFSRSFNKISQALRSQHQMLTCLRYTLYALRSAYSAVLHRNEHTSNQNMSGSLLDTCLLFIVRQTTCGQHVVSLFMLSLQCERLSLFCSFSLSLSFFLFAPLSFVTFSLSLHLYFIRTVIRSFLFALFSIPITIITSIEFFDVFLY